MRVIIEDNEEKMSESAMQILLGTMMQDKTVNISLTSGRSPKQLYEMMAPYIRGTDKYDNVEYWLFDEAPYFGKKEGQPGPNRNEMQELFFEKADIPDKRIHCPDMSTWETWDETIDRAGGIDVMLIGLGWDGHFCSNCPNCTPLDAYTYARPRKVTNAANPTYPERPDRPYSITMGPLSLMKVKRLVMIVNGIEKTEIFRRFLTEPISEEIPSTILRLHPNFTVIADQQAATLITEEDLRMLNRARF